MRTVVATVTQCARTVATVSACAGVLSASTLSAQQGDLKGSRDHPLVSRYEGSAIIGYEERIHDEFVLPLGPARREGTLAPEKSTRLEGKITRILYVAPEGRSTLEVFRNYELALKRAGAELLFTCVDTACGGESRLIRFLYPVSRALKGPRFGYAFRIPREERYLAAKLSRPEGPAYVSAFVARENNSALTDQYNRPVILLEIIEPKSMEVGLVTVDAAARAKEISATGHVALYGIHFDFNRADIKPESQPTLQEIAKLLRQDPQLRLFVVGHTDNVGGHQFNIALSRRRAAAVVKALTSEHAIDASRLQAEGVGFLAPLAPNDTEEGQAKNRRVELVRP